MRFQCAVAFLFQYIVTRLGRWIDFKNDYKTMYPWFMETIWWVFKELYNKGLVYRGFKVSPGSQVPDFKFSVIINCLNISISNEYVNTAWAGTSEKKKEYFLGFIQPGWLKPVSHYLYYHLSKIVFKKRTIYIFLNFYSAFHVKKQCFIGLHQVSTSEPS